VGRAPHVSRSAHTGSCRAAQSTRGCRPTGAATPFILAGRATGRPPLAHPCSPWASICSRDAVLQRRNARIGVGIEGE
jgi:hypothetical protein